MECRRCTFRAVLGWTFWSGRFWFWFLNTNLLAVHPSAAKQKIKIIRIRNFIRFEMLTKLRKKERFQRKKSLQSPRFWKTVWYSVNKGGCKICYKVATAPLDTYFLYSSILNSWILFLSLESKSVTSRLNSSAQDMAENCYLPQVGSYFAFFRVYSARKMTHVKILKLKWLMKI